MVGLMKMMLWRDDVHLAHVVQSSQQRHDVRIRLYLRMEHNGVEGWGEIDPQPFALNGDPSVDEIVYELDKVLVTQVAGAFEREATAPSWTASPSRSRTSRLCSRPPEPRPCRPQPPRRPSSPQVQV